MELILSQVQDKVTRENFLRIKKKMEALESMIDNIEIAPVVDGGGGTVTAEVATVQVPDGLLQWSGFSVACGSTSTTCFRLSGGTFSTTGTAPVTYESNTVSGDTFTILQDGYYTFNFAFDVAAASNFIGITKNATGYGATLLQSIPEQFILSKDYTTDVVHTHWAGPLTQGTVIRLQASAAATVSSAVIYSHLSIGFVGRVKQVNVNEESTATWPTSFLKFDGASSRGSTNTAIVNFITQSVLRGNAFEVNPLGPSSTHGTHVRILKAGVLSVHSTLYFGASAGAMVIGKNLTGTYLTTAIAPAANMSLAGGGGSTSTVFPSATSSEVDVEVGDIIYVWSNVLPVTAPQTIFSLFHKEKEIQVSVSNSLPQFSESDLSVKCAGNGGQVITANVTDTPFTVSYDSTGGAWNGSQFTIPADGIYNFSGYVLFNASVAGVVQIYVNGVAYRTVSDSATQSQKQFGIEETFSTGQVISFRHTSTATLVSNTAVHYLNITKVGKPNVESVDVTPFVNIPMPAQYSTVQAGAITITGSVSNPTKGTILTDKVSYVRRGEYAVITYQFNQTTASSTAGSGSYYFGMPAGLFIDTTKFTIGHATSSVCGSGWLTSNADGRDVQVFAIDNSKFALGYANASNVTISATSHSMSATAFYSFSFTVEVPIAGWSVTSNQIITEVETFSSDTATFVYAPSTTYTLATLANAPVGTYITFAWTASSYTRTQTTTRPTQTDLDMNANGILMYHRTAYAAATTAAQPSTVAIQIGKGLKGLSLSLHKSAGKIGNGSLDYFYAANSEKGMEFKQYNEVTGILYLDCGVIEQSTTTTATFIFDDITNQAWGYLTINASKNPALTGVNAFKPVCATALKIVAQSIPNGTDTVLTWDTAGEVDTNGAFNPANGTFTCPAGRAGWYNINCNLLMDSFAWTTGTSFDMWVTKNNISTEARTRTHGTGVAIYLSTQIQDLVYLGAGDTLRVVVYQGSGAARNTYIASGWNKIKIHRVG